MEPDLPPEPDIAIEISDTQSHLRIDAGELARLARAVLAGEGVSRASVSISLVDDATIHALNRRHLGHDWPTDVITFPLSAPGDEELSGELVLSAEMALKTAGASGIDPQDELALYLVHGLLHLCGHDDQTPEQAAAMRRREDEVLRRLGRVNPFDRAGATPREDAPCSR
jgi:probable rRNA maturation factor